MTTIDLQQFCGTDPCRPYLMKPFSFGEFTYATNGHIMVRIPRDCSIPEIELASSKSVDWNAPLRCHEGAVFAPLDVVLPPVPPEGGECDYCYEGRVHKCPGCECECPRCDGAGQETPEQFTSADVNGQPLTLRYVRLALSLPGIEFGGGSDNTKPMPFKFDGGIGAIMPRNRKSHDHIELQKKVSDHQS